MENTKMSDIDRRNIEELFEIVYLDMKSQNSNMKFTIDEMKEIIKEKSLSELLNLDIHPSFQHLKTSNIPSGVTTHKVDGIDYNKSVIEVRNLIKTFKQGKNSETILKSIDINIIKGAITTIVGPSGSGKTTLLNMISGLDSADSGTITVDGLQIVGMSEDQLVQYRLEKLGFIFQSYNLIADLTVKENVEIVKSLSTNPMDVDEVLELVGLSHAKNKYPYQLSGGMQQRVSIARALVKNPQILVCDEPTGALDEKTGKDVLALLQDLPKKTGTSIILVTHNPGIKAMSHAVIEVKNGKINEYYTNEEIIDAHDINWG